MTGNVTVAHRRRYDVFAFGIRRCLGHLADHRPRICTEDFAYLEDRGEAGDVPACFDFGEARQRLHRTASERGISAQHARIEGDPDRQEMVARGPVVRLTPLAVPRT